jgi:hypothetical protein
MKWKVPGQGNDKGKAASDKYARPKPAADGGRTSLVRRSDEDTTGSPAGGSQPDSRLSWPARDQHQPKKVTYYSCGGSQANSDETHFHNPSKNSPAPAPATLNDPVVGWLVVTEGPGRGRSLEIGIGANSIGRDARQKIALNFGDDTIHRTQHATLVFDPKSRNFFLQAGSDSRNLTYIEDALVLAPVQLRGGEIIVIGQTKLVFVAFCGPNFSWS